MELHQTEKLLQSKGTHQKNEKQLTKWKKYLQTTYIFAFIVHAFGVISKKSLLRTMSGNFILMFSSRSLWFQVLHLSL